MGSGSLQIDPKPFKKVELALFCLYLKELVGKMQENPSIRTLFKSRWSRNARSKSSISQKLKNHKDQRFDLVYKIDDFAHSKIEDCYGNTKKV